MTGLRLLQVLTLVCLALALIPAGAHLFEMPGKLALPPETYIQVQTIYAGWALFGIPIYLAMILLLILAIAQRQGGLILTLLALLLMAGTQGLFWAYTQPMNEITQNWTVPPPNLAAARTQWEYSHAASAILTYLAFLSATVAIVQNGSRRY